LGIGSHSIRPDKQGFTFFFYLFYQIYTLYLSSIRTLLDGGHELSDAANYQWLVRSTISADITDHQIEELSRLFYSDAPVSRRNRQLLKEGLSFRLPEGATFRDLGADDFLVECCAERNIPRVTRLFAYLYDQVPNRLTRRLGAEEKHFERVIFAVLMKQLGFLVEVYDISLRLGNGESPVITHYMKQALESIYKIRVILSVSRQATQQFESRVQSGTVLPATLPESLREDYFHYREEILKKCVFLLHIQPCLRFRRQDFELAFPAYLKRLQHFLVSETLLSEYFHLITSSEEARRHTVDGMEMMNAILTSDAPVLCKTYAIEELAVHDSFLNFLSTFIDGSATDTNVSCLHTVEKLLHLIGQMMTSCESVNAAIALYLNLVLMLQKLGSSTIFPVLTALWRILEKMETSDVPSFKAYFMAGVHLLHDRDIDFVKHPSFVELMDLVFPFPKLQIGHVYLARLCWNMTVPIKATVSDLVELVQSASLLSLPGIVSLMGDLLSSSSTTSDFMWPLEQLSQIAAGGFSFLSTAPPPAPIVFSVAAVLVDMFRKFLQLHNPTVIEISRLSFAIRTI
jgi:hypothetical protein